MTIVLQAAALLAAGFYCVLVGTLAWNQRKLLYAPETNPCDVSEAGVPNATAITVHTRDGLDLTAWFAPPADDTQPVVLYLHGNGGHIGYRAPRLARLASFGWGVLLLEYRGFGNNQGTPTETGLSQDASAAHSTLTSLGIQAHRILLWGESLGTGIAVRLATEAEVGAVLLESPYTSITALGQKRFPYAPVWLLLKDRFNLIGRIGKVRAPVLVMTGAKDDIIPPSMGQAVFAAANEPKVFWLAEKAGHNTLAEAGAFNTVQNFVKDHWPPCGKFRPYGLSSSE